MLRRAAKRQGKDLVDVLREAIAALAGGEIEDATMTPEEALRKAEAEDNEVPEEAKRGGRESSLRRWARTR